MTLKNLTNRLRVGAHAGPSTEAEIAQLLEFAKRHEILVPDDYLEVIRQATDLELIVEDRGCIRIWSATAAVEMNEAYEVQKYLPDALAIGDDEGGKAIALMDGPGGPGMYRFPFADPDRSEANYIAPRLSLLLADGVGIDRLFDWEE
jgi:hypothetical protein